jgi:hypothetical protein
MYAIDPKTIKNFGSSEKSVGEFLGTPASRRHKHALRMTMLIKSCYRKLTIKKS